MSNAFDGANDEDEVGRPSESDARVAIEAWLDKHAPGYPTYSMHEDGDGWAFWIVDVDTTSYLRSDMTIQWYGTYWPSNFDYDGDTGAWLPKSKLRNAP